MEHIQRQTTGLLGPRPDRALGTERLRRAASDRSYYVCPDDVTVAPFGTLLLILLEHLGRPNLQKTHCTVTLCSTLESQPTVPFNTPLAGRHKTTKSRGPHYFPLQRIEWNTQNTLRVLSVGHSIAEGPRKRKGPKHWELTERRGFAPTCWMTGIMFSTLNLESLCAWTCVHIAFSKKKTHRTPPPKGVPQVQRSHNSHQRTSPQSTQRVWEPE